MHHLRLASSCRHLVRLTAMTLLLGSAALASDVTPQSSDRPDLSAVRAKIYSGSYDEAARELQTLTTTVQHADVYNLLGFSLRKLQRYDEAAKWYREALRYDATHRPALEYQGELFIDIADYPSAQKNLQLLRLLCFPKGCEEYDKLKEALLRAGQKPAS